MKSGHPCVASVSRHHYAVCCSRQSAGKQWLGCSSDFHPEMCGENFHSFVDSASFGWAVPAVYEIIKSEKTEWVDCNESWWIMESPMGGGGGYGREFISLCHHEGWEIIYWSSAGEHWWWSLLISLSLFGLCFVWEKQSELQRAHERHPGVASRRILQLATIQSDMIIWTLLPASAQDPHFWASSCACEHLAHCNKSTKRSQHADWQRAFVVGDIRKTQDVRRWLCGEEVSCRVL